MRGITRGSAQLAGLGVAGAVNSAVAVGLATGRAAYAAAAAAVPPVVAGFIALAASSRAALVFAALAIEFIGRPVNEELELPAGLTVFAPDVLLLLVVGSWLVATLVAPEDRRPRRLRSPLLGIPLALLTAALLIGLIKGHLRYEASLLGMPLRLAIYAGIGLAMTDLTAKQAFRGIVAVFYAGTVWLALLGLYHLVTATSQTEYLELSTGGTRYLGIVAATYLAGALMLALLNLNTERRAGMRALHLTIAALAAFGAAIAFTRAVYVALAVLVPVLLLGFGGVRRAVLGMAPAILPALAALALIVPVVAPGVVSTLESRLTTNPGADSSVEWRDRAYEVALRGVDREPFFGVGFGRESTFYIDGAPNLIEGDPHNGFLYLLAGGGAFALGAYVLLILVYLRDSAKRLIVARGRERVLVAWAVATWFVFLLHSVVEPVLTEPAMLMTMWILMLLPAALVPLRGERLRESARLVDEHVAVDAGNPVPAGQLKRPRRSGTA